MRTPRGSAARAATLARRVVTSSSPSTTREVLRASGGSARVRVATPAKRPRHTSPFSAAKRLPSTKKSESGSWKTGAGFPVTPSQGDKVKVAFWTDRVLVLIWEAETQSDATARSPSPVWWVVCDCRLLRRLIYVTRARLMGESTPRDAQHPLTSLVRPPRDGARGYVKQHPRTQPPRQRPRALLLGDRSEHRPKVTRAVGRRRRRRRSVAPRV